MYLHNLALRFRWFQVPTGMLIMLLQRTPVLRVAVQFQGMLSENATAIMRSAFAVAATKTTATARSQRNAHFRTLIWDSSLSE